MSMQYEALKPPRFRVETINGRDEITIGAQRNLFLMLFLLFWVSGWTFGGGATITTLFSRGFQPFLLFWLCGWAFGEACVLAILCWQFSGAEIIRIQGADLEIGCQMLGFTRRKLFRGSEIRDLSACQPQIFNRYNQMSLPFFVANKTGSVKFAYGARTIYVAPGLDEAEGRLIVDRLRGSLPSTATT